MRRGLERVAGLVRLVHPFPILVDAAATTVIAGVAGASPSTALGLGLGMLLLQASIGSLNDLVDAPADAGRKTGKPIPAGLVSSGVAKVVVLVAGVGGLAVSAAFGPLALVIGLAIAGTGVAYDLRFKGTAWSWLPFAVGIPLLPVYAWAGATGSIARGFAVLVPAAALAGAALAIANALADADRDRDAGVDSVALRLGPGRAWAVHVVLHAAVGALATVTAAGAGEAVAPLLPPLLVIAVGCALARSSSPARRERGWEAEVLGVAGLAAVWVATVPLR